SLLAAAEAAPLDEMARAQLDLLRARQAIFSGDLRSAATLDLRAARRLESLDVDLAFAAHLQAMGAAVVTGPGDGVTIREAAAAALACKRSEKPSALESLAVGLAVAALDGPGAAAPIVRAVLSAGHDDFGVDAFQWLGYMVAGAA